MAKYNFDFGNVDIEKLFEEYTIEQLLEIEHLLDTDIEKKRCELRGMVGDRYKDVLTASDAIKSMKHISEGIVDKIKAIIDNVTNLVDTASAEHQSASTVINPAIVEERTIIMQIKLAIVICDQIWIAIDKQDLCVAAQLYLLAQYIHTGLRLLRKEILNRIPLLKLMKSDVDALRNRILKHTKEKLQCIQLSADETSSNLNALMLLENQSLSALLDIFIELRKTALELVINESHFSVRAQVTSMVQCLVTTVHLLHDCFIKYEDSNVGLIGQQFHSMVDDSAPTTLSKVDLPASPLNSYIPEILKQFRPKCLKFNSVLEKADVDAKVNRWLEHTKEIVKNGLENSLKLVPNIKGLQIIREEALKIELPINWDSICCDINLPSNFNLWQYFFQTLITERAEEILTKKVSVIRHDLQEELKRKVVLDQKENDLRWYSWNEEPNDISKTENQHLGLTMKVKGYSPNIVKMCENLENNCKECLKDISCYLYGKEFEENVFITAYLLPTRSRNEVFVDRIKLEKHLCEQFHKNCLEFTIFLAEFVNSASDANENVTRSLFCARLLQALTELCSNFKRCSIDEYDKICNAFNQSSIQFWASWVENCKGAVAVDCSRFLTDSDPYIMLSVLPKWDTIEIQEQTDETTFKSKIKLPSQPSLGLESILGEMAERLNSVLAYTIPRQIHVQFLETSVAILLDYYNTLSSKELNQTQALQYLFDVKFMTTLCVPKENVQLNTQSQEICDKLRSKIDPFDLDVFYSYLQNNVKRSIFQTQIILGCLIPNANQLSSLGVSEKNKEQEKEPSILALSTPASSGWFPLLPVTAPIQKTVTTTLHNQSFKDVKGPNKPSKAMKKAQDATSSVRSGAVALLGAMANDWFS